LLRLHATEANDEMSHASLGNESMLSVVQRIGILIAAFAFVGLTGPAGAVAFFTDRAAFEAATTNRLVQTFEGECWDEPNGAYPPGFGWRGWYVTYGFNQTPPYYMPAPIPAAAGLVTTDIVGVGAYQQDQKVLRVMSETYGTNYGSGQYVQWDKYGAVPDPNDQDYLFVGLNPGKAAVGLDFMQPSTGASVEVKVFSGAALLDTRTVAVPARPDRGFVGFTSGTGVITRLEMRLQGSLTAGNLDNLTWGDMGSPTISGTISLGGFAGDLRDVALRIDLFAGGSIFRTDRVMLSSGGAFSVSVPAGIYDVRLKTYTSLASKVVGVDVSGDSVDLRTVILKNGDADGDNEVTTSDLSVVLANAQVP
jgi:hypothetical protein